MKLKENIPNFITCLNLLCGCVGIVFAFEGNLVWSAYLVGIAAVLDFLDGFVARILKVHSAIGKQLDSLADMVTFGVLPGVMMFHFINLSNGVISFAGSISTATLPGLNATLFPDTVFVSFVAFLIPTFSAIRLAKFNLDLKQEDSFVGLPTPANTIFIASLVFIINPYYPLEIDYMLSNISPQFALSDIYIGGQAKSEIVSNPTFGMTLFYLIFRPEFFLLLTILLSYLLISPIRLFALKFKNFGWADNKVRYIFLALSAVLLILFQALGIPLIIVLYIVLSVINNLVNRKASPSSR
ncbi:MAG: CDP-alcohol phosphatidyltransferase family protein [Bacteroidota bacterium]